MASVAPAPHDPGFPAGIRLTLDRSTKAYKESLILVGGSPKRMMRLSPAGRDAILRMGATGAGERKSERMLARRLIDTGMMHPTPASCAGLTADLTVVIPTRDRPGHLNRCLTALMSASTRPSVIVVDDGSADPQATERLCARFGAVLQRHHRSLGPAAARNTGAAVATTSLIAFLDSDCIVEQNWLQRLLPHFQDPLLAAIAPRVRPVTDTTTAVGRFAVSRAPIDLGARPGAVIPGSRISYVPTAALVVRQTAIGSGFDTSLRYGEDVDLVWRLHEAGWKVRYEPSVQVQHREPDRWADLIKRRYGYGTSAGPLAQRHPGKLAPLIVSPWSAAITLPAITWHPICATAALAIQTAQLTLDAHRKRIPLAAVAADPLRGAFHLAAGSGRTATMLTPWLLAAGLRSPKARRTATALLLIPTVSEWMQRRPGLDPLRWVAFATADDIAYGAGTLVGSFQARTICALMPKLMLRPRA